MTEVGMVRVQVGEKHVFRGHHDPPHILMGTGPKRPQIFGVSYVCAQYEK